MEANLTNKEKLTQEFKLILRKDVYNSQDLHNANIIVNLWKKFNYPNM